MVTRIASSDELFIWSISLWCRTTLGRKFGNVHFQSAVPLLITGFTQLLWTVTAQLILKMLHEEKTGFKCGIIINRNERGDQIPDLGGEKRFRNDCINPLLNILHSNYLAKRRIALTSERFLHRGYAIISFVYHHCEQHDNISNREHDCSIVYVQGDSGI